MMFKGLMDVLLSKNEGITRIWMQKVRNSQNLKKYNTLSDAELMHINEDMYKMLARWIDRDIDKNQIGSFFVDLGKVRRREGFPISEISYALLLAQRSVLEYLTNESLVDSSMVLYQILNLTKQVADFFFLGCYYMEKGHLEDTYVALNRDEAMTDDMLKKYFADDFFFKDADRK
jgi:hypothetical protein